MVLAMYEILRGGGFSTGGFNFDTKLRRQSVDRTDLFHGHIAGIDTLARALLVAAALVDDGVIEAARTDRYARWDGTLGREIMRSGASLGGLADHATDAGLDPVPVSGRQELLEHEINKAIWSVGV
jgi:xylose isomerase